MAKALHYYAKRFYAPILLSADNENGKISFNVCNETLREFNGLIEAALIKNDFTPIKTYRVDVCVGALSSKDCFNLTDLLKGNERNYSMVFRLVSESEKVLSEESILFVKPKFFHFAEPNFNLKIRKNESGFIAEISADKFAKGVCLQVADPDAIFEDNYFSIIDCSVKTVAFRSKLSLEELKQSFKINSINRIVCES